MTSINKSSASYVSFCKLILTHLYLLQAGEMFMGGQGQGQGMQGQATPQQPQQQAPPRQLMNMNPLINGGQQQTELLVPNLNLNSGKGVQLARGGSITSRLGGGGPGGGGMALQPPPQSQSSMQMQGIIQNQNISQMMPMTQQQQAPHLMQGMPMQPHNQLQGMMIPPQGQQGQFNSMIPNPQGQGQGQQGQLMQGQQMQQPMMQGQQMAQQQQQPYPMQGVPAQQLGGSWQEMQSSGQQGGGSSHSEDHRKQVLKQQQQRLLLLRHASKCPHDFGRCPVTPHCGSMQHLWKHIMTCKDQECKVPHCVSSRYVLSHYSKCKDHVCPVCGPVREAIRRNFERSKEVVKLSSSNPTAPKPVEGNGSMPGFAYSGMAGEGDYGMGLGFGNNFGNGFGANGGAPQEQVALGQPMGGQKITGKKQKKDKVEKEKKGEDGHVAKKQRTRYVCVYINIYSYTHTYIYMQIYVYTCI
jgi:hypothetical protein